MKKIKKWIFIFLLTTNANALCMTTTPLMADLIARLCWECIFPISLGGVVIVPGVMPDSNMITETVCTCSDPIPRVGIPFGFWEPSRVIEVVKDPYCFPTLGISSGTATTLSGTTTDAHDRGKYFAQVHYLIFPVFGILEIAADYMKQYDGGVVSACFDTTGIDYGYLTEIDPLWQDDQLSGFLNPEAILFGNPISNLACIADAVTAQFNVPLDFLFWCKGSWGNAYPLTGNTLSKDHVEDAASVAASMIYKLHRELILWGTIGLEGACGKYPMPIWKKSSYRLQIVTPVPHPIGMGIGQSGLLWSFGKSIPFTGDNFSFMLFKKRDCCLF